MFLPVVFPVSHIIYPAATPPGKVRLAQICRPQSRLESKIVASYCNQLFLRASNVGHDCHASTIPVHLKNIVESLPFGKFCDSQENVFFHHAVNRYFGGGGLEYGLRLLPLSGLSAPVREIVPVYTGKALFVQLMWFPLQCDSHIFGGRIPWIPGCNETWAASRPGRAGTPPRFPFFRPGSRAVAPVGIPAPRGAQLDSAGREDQP